MNQFPLPRLAVIPIVLMLAAVSLTSQAQVQAKLQAAIFVKLLNYDTALAKKSQSRITFHIIVDSGTVSKQAALKKEFGVISQQKIAGKTVTIVVTPLSSATSAVSKDSAHVFYLPDGSSRSTLSKILIQATAQKIPVLAGNAELAQSGAGVGITVSNGKPQIIVNLKQSKAMGMSLSSQLLKLAKII